MSGFRLIFPLAGSTTAYYSSITTAEINLNSQPMDDWEPGSGKLQALVINPWL